MNANLTLVIGVTILVIAVTILVIAVVMARIARRHAASAAPVAAPAPAPAPAASRTIGEAVGEVHDSLDGLIVRTIDGIGTALAAAIPAPIFVGAAPAGGGADLQACRQHLAAMQAILDAL